MTVLVAATVPGQPPSWNRSYRIVTVRGRSVLAKTKDAAKYQDDALLILRAAAKLPAKIEQYYVFYEFFLARDIDTDNVLKMLNDSIARATGVDDRYFLPVVLRKEVGCEEPHITVLVVARSYVELAVRRRTGEDTPALAAGAEEP